MSGERTVRHLVDHVLGCCLKEGDVPVPLNSPIEELAAYSDETGCCGEINDVTFFKAAGRFLVFSEYADTTGHGCQCGASVSAFDTYDDAVRLGLSADDAAHLGLSAVRERIVKAFA